MYEGFAVSALWKLMGWLPGYLLRLRFSKEALIARTRIIDVRNRPHAVQLNGGDISEATIWITIQNAGYFPIELDRMTVVLTLAGTTLEFFHLDRATIPADTTHEVYVRGPLNPGVIAHYKLNKKNGDVVSVMVRAEFNSKIHNFAVRTGYLSGVAARDINM